MTDCVITIENPARPEIRAIFIRAHLRLRLAGMQARYRTPNKSLLEQTAAITGGLLRKNSKAGITLAIADLTRFIEEHKQ